MALYGPNTSLMTEIVSSQIRAARGVLDWTIEKLALESGVGSRTIKRYEAITGIPNSKKDNLAKIRHTFELAGIEFIGTPEDRPGVRLNISK